MTMTSTNNLVKLVSLFGDVWENKLSDDTKISLHNHYSYVQGYDDIVMVNDAEDIPLTAVATLAEYYINHIAFLRTLEEMNEFCDICEELNK